MLERVLVDELDANLESVCRNEERRFWGGWAEVSMGSLGSEALGRDSRSLSCKSMISVAFLVSVMLWVGAAKREEKMSTLISTKGA